MPAENAAANPVRRQGGRCLAIVLAAGEGTRMRSHTPKVLHKAAGRSMLAHVLNAVAAAGADDLAIVIGPNRQDVATAARDVAPLAEIFVQTERLGTAHAVLAARAALARGYDDVIIAFADTPLVTAETFLRLRAALAAGADVVVLGFLAENPTGYGRILLDGDQQPCAIREQKDASPQELDVALCNAGLIALSGAKALELLDRVQPHNAQKEYYLTDVVQIARDIGLKAAYLTAAESEVMGVNDRIQLALVEALFQDRFRLAAQRAGVTLVAPSSVFLSADTVFGQDVVVEPYVVIGPNVQIGEGAHIRAFSYLEGIHVPAGASIGPFTPRP